MRAAATPPPGSTAPSVTEGEIGSTAPSVSEGETEAPTTELRNEPTAVTNKEVKNGEPINENPEPPTPASPGDNAIRSR